MKKIIVIGGYGVFGKRICESLAHIPNIELIIAGRSIEKAKALINDIKIPSSQLTARIIDIHQIHSSGLDKENIFALINASGPYHEQNYDVAKYCIEHEIHYIDLADNRDFVKGIAKLDAQAKEKDILVTSGASTVPALSSAVIDHFQHDFLEIHEIDYGVTPGNQTDRGVSTVSAILSYVGKPFKTRINKEQKQIYGWQNLHQRHYPVIGKRYMSNCNIPDLDLFPNQYGSLKTLRFYAGLELGILHIGLWLLSWPSRIGLLKKPEKLASLLRNISLWFYPLGTKSGGMHVIINGIDKNQNPLQKEWYLIAEKGDGPYIPATPSIILVKKLLNERYNLSGAKPCMSLFTLNDFKDEISDLNVKEYTNEPLYVRYLNERYTILPQAVQKLHNYNDEIIYSGQCNVTRGRNPFCKISGVDVISPPSRRRLPFKSSF